MSSQDAATSTAPASMASTTANPAGAALTKQNISFKTFAASLSIAAIIFGVQITIFLILSGNWKLRKSEKSSEKNVERQGLFQKIYYYKTAFVPKAKRISPPTTAIESFKNVFTIGDRELIRVAGVDGYLFLGYLQLLLRIFVPMAIVILPILLPINRKGDVPTVSGLDQFAWSNVGVPSKVRRLWAHLVLAVCVVLWVCFNFYLALRKFIRLRQTILTLPEHRIRASATTILVQSIPRKWHTMAALEALYDVFPGGIRDIWINRDYDELMEKVNKRTNLARALETAETNLIIQCTQKHKEQEEKAAKAAGKKQSKKDKRSEQTVQNQAIHNEASEPGMDVGNPHQIEATLQEVFREDAASSSSSSSSMSSRSTSPQRKRGLLPIPLVGKGLHAVGEGIRDVGRVNKKILGGVKFAFGGRHRHQDEEAESTKPEVDGHAEFQDPSASSEGANYRAASTDTHTPLAVRDDEKTDLERADLTPTKHPAEEVDPEEAAEKPSRGGFWPLQRLKDAYLGKGDFVSPQPYRDEGEVPHEIESSETIKYETIGLYNDAFAEDGEDALWRKYIRPKDRETMRIPLFDKSWWPSLPLLGKKVDTIYYCRKEVARLNAEIADDQAHPERFPLMNSAFIQFNHQVAAHMACQSVSYHIPRQMAPRTVEVNPNYVMWDNLSMKWWEKYLRMLAVVVLIIVLIIFWGFPVSFTGALSQIDKLSSTLHWLRWINKLPTIAISMIQGVLPPLLLAILFALLPIVLRFLAGLTGTATMGERELLVQNFYFAFSFVQLFLVVSISTGITSTIDKLVHNPTSVPATLAQNLPQAANYFFSYMILQALSISSGTLLQIGSVIVIVFLGFLDTTPREKVSRVLSRPSINWGTMIPVYTNLAAIGLVYSIIAPLILVMMLITFSLFWFTYRYQMIYVSYAKAETNGLIFPKAVNQLFTGLYFLELVLVGLFLLQRDEKNQVSCFPQAIIMVITLAFTILYQIVLNRAFGPLFEYLPITFEDEAVARDEEWDRAQRSRWEKENEEHQSLTTGEYKQAAEDDTLAQLEGNKRPTLGDKRYSSKGRNSSNGEVYELNSLDQHASMNGVSSEKPRHRPDWAMKSRHSSHSHHSHSRSHSRPRSHRHTPKKEKRRNPLDAITVTLRHGVEDVARPMRDIEAQVMPTRNIFDDIDDELADIEPEARQKLIKRSFQHPASRAIQPAIWIPHDDLGIAKDEIQRTHEYTKNVWITSVNARLDAAGRVLYRGLPPDRDPFENIEV